MNRLTRLILFFLGITFLAAPHANLWGAEQGAAETLRSFVDTIRAMEFPITDTAQHAEKVKRADAAVDLEAMGKRALGPHWDKAPEADRKAFMELLWKLIENIAYPRSRSFLGSLPIDYAEPKNLEQGVEIKTTVKNQDEALNAEIVYDLYEINGQWKIYDIFLDGVTITEDLKYQFDRIIRDSSFSGLLDKMKERLVKAEQENTKK